MILPIFALAVRIVVYNGVVIQESRSGTLTIEIDRGENYPDDQRIKDYTVTPSSGDYSVGDYVSFSVNEDASPPFVVVESLEKGTDPNANAGVGSKTNVSGYRLFPGLSCDSSDQPLTCFTQAVFRFAQIAIIVLAVGAIVIAGITYMTSAGNPKRVETSKKLIIGALTGVAVMVLGRLFLTKVIGVEWPW